MKTIKNRRLASSDLLCERRERSRSFRAETARLSEDIYGFGFTPGIVMRMVVIVLFVIIPLGAFAQLEITASTGYASFGMHDMSTFQRQVNSELPVRGKITSSFPPFWTFEISGIKWDRSLVSGAALNYSSTGGRIYYSDYSGMVRVDQLLSCIGLDAIIGTRIGEENEKWMMLAQLRGGILMTYLDFELEEAVGSQQQTEVLEFTSLSGTLQPTFTITRQFNWIGVQALAGYHFTVLPGKLYFKDNDEAYLMMSGDKALKADWSGFRISLGVTFSFEQ